MTFSIYLKASILNTNYSPELSSVAMVMPLLKITITFLTKISKKQQFAGQNHCQPSQEKIIKIHGW